MVITTAGSAIYGSPDRVDCPNRRVQGVSQKMLTQTLREPLRAQRS